MTESSLMVSGDKEGVPLLPGENVCVALLKDVTYLCPYQGPITGKLLVSNYKLHFYQSRSSKVPVSVFVN